MNTGLTQVEAARRCGVHRNTIRRWEAAGRLTRLAGKGARYAPAQVDALASRKAAAAGTTPAGDDAALLALAATSRRLEAEFATLALPPRFLLSCMIRWPGLNEQRTREILTLARGKNPRSLVRWLTTVFLSHGERPADPPVPAAYPADTPNRPRISVQEALERGY